MFFSFLILIYLMLELMQNRYLNIKCVELFIRDIYIMLSSTWEKLRNYIVFT